MRSNVETKEEHLKLLHSLQKSIETKGIEIDEVAKKIKQGEI
jgi:hypothetical protein